MKKEDFISALTASNLEKYLPRFEALMQDSIRYHLTQIQDYADVAIGSSRMGGFPDFPPTLIWPADNNGTPLAFIAQLNLKEIHPFDQDQLLPDKGVLYFFFDGDQGMGGYAANEKHLFRIIYFDGNDDALEPVKDYPENFPEPGQFWPCSFTYTREMFLPDRWSKEYAFMTPEEKELFFSKVYPGAYINKTLGIPDILQGNDMPYLCQKVYPESAEEDWVLLLQVDSNEQACMNWSDAGRIYYWIRKQDLEKRNFDNCWCVMQDM